MINGCENCIAYLIRYSKSAPEPCHECCQETLVWKQNLFGTFYMECLNCGAEVYVDLNTPCELDNSMYEKIKIEIKPQEHSQDVRTTVKIAKYLALNALELRRKLIEGYVFEIDHSKLIELVNILEKTNIDYVVKQDKNPTELYPLYKECRYPYSPMQSYLASEKNIID